jgi:hypothetical protein
MMKLKNLILCLILSATTACVDNIFVESADTETPDAIFFAAKQEINNRNYNRAVLLLQSLTPDYLNVRVRVPIHASAYAGRCGLEFISLLEALQSTNSSAVLGMLMGSFPGAEIDNVNDCIFASDLLQDIGDESVRDGNENLLLAFVSLAKMGVILSSLADLDDDGVADATFDQCDNNDLPEAMVREVGASLAVTILSLSAVGGGYIDGTVDSFADLCAQDPNLQPFCNTTDPTSFSAAEVQAFRYAIGSNDFGIDSCGGLNLSDCATSNPVCP